MRQLKWFFRAVTRLKRCDDALPFLFKNAYSSRMHATFIPRKESTFPKNDSSVAISFQNLVSTLENNGDLSKMDYLIRLVYEELARVGDWKTGITMIKLLKKHGMKAETKDSSSLPYLMLVAYFNSGKTPEMCWDFIDRLSRLSLICCERCYIFVSRVTIMYSDKISLLRKSVDMLSQLSHVPISRGPLFIYYGMKAEQSKITDLYNISLQLFKKRYKPSGIIVNDLEQITSHPESKSRLLPVWLLEHTLCLATELVYGSKDRLYSVFPSDNPQIHNYQCTMARKLLFLSVKIISISKDALSKEDDCWDLNLSDGVGQHGLMSTNDACAFTVDTYSGIPFASTLNILMNAFISVFRATMYTQGPRNLETFRKELEAFVKEHLCGQVSNARNILTCIKIASSFCLADYLLKNNNPEASKMSLANFSNGEEGWQNIILQHLKILVNTYSCPASTKLFHKTFQNVVPKTHINCASIYKRSLLESTSLCMSVLESRTYEENFELRVNKRCIAPVAVSLLAYLTPKSTRALTFAESTLYMIFVERESVDINYFKALLRSHVISLNNNFSRSSHDHSINQAATILFRARLNNLIIDTEMMIYILEIMTNRQPDFASCSLGTFAARHSRSSAPMFKILSFLHLHLEALRGRISEKFVTTVIKSLLSNQLYQDFNYIYGRLKYNYRYRPSVDMYLEIIKGYSLTHRGCVYVAKEYHFELKRDLEYARQSWTTKLVDAVLHCCIVSGSTTSALSFASSHISKVSKPYLEQLLEHLKEFNSLCENEQKLVTSWISKATTLNEITTLNEVTSSENMSTIEVLNPVTSTGLNSQVCAHTKNSNFSNELENIRNSLKKEDHTFNLPNL